MEILLPILAQYPIVSIILAVLGCLVVVGQAIVAITPSKKDDEAVEKVMKNGLVAKIVDGLKAFAPIQKK